ncbi:MAG: hypothetical protein ACOY9Y_08915 [Bacillota bacterium]
MWQKQLLNPEAALDNCIRLWENQSYYLEVDEEDRSLFDCFPFACRLGNTHTYELNFDNCLGHFSLGK